MPHVTYRGRHYLLITAGELMESDTGHHLFTTTADGAEVEGVLNRVERRDAHSVVLHLDIGAAEVLAVKQVGITTG